MKRKNKLLSMIVTGFLLLSTIVTTGAADLINILDSTSTTSEIYHKNQIEHETIPMMAIEDVLVYNAPNDQSTAVLSLSGGTVVNACVKTVGEDYLMIIYNKHLCYAKANEFKMLIGDTSSIYEYVYTVYQEHKYQAEGVVQLKSAPKYYSVNGEILYYNYQDFIWTLCDQWGITNHFEYLLCQFYQESRFKQSAISPTQDYGICQLNIRYHEWFKMEAGHPEWDVIKDPYANMYVGVYLMATYISERNQDIALALTDYNAGPYYANRNGIKQDYYGPICYWYTTLKQIN